MQSVLIIHHLESMWNDSYKRIAGKDFLEIAFDLARSLNRRKFDRIILTQMENFEPEEGHFESGIAEHVHQWEEYGYGWDLDEQETTLEEMPDFVDGGNHSKHVYVPDWIKKLKGNKVTLCGAFDGECIEDMEIALKSCQVDFARWEKFII